jgi:RNA polymerase sigma-32 factor
MSDKPQLPATSSGGLKKSSLLNQYLAEVRRYPILTPEEEHDLAVRYRDEGDEDAGKLLVKSNLRLVVKMAFKFHSQWANVLDLIQQGNMGLMQALSKYDPYNETKTRFSTYAAYWVRSCIYNYIKDNYRIVRLGSTRHGRRLFDNLRKEREKLLQMGITPTTKALSDSMDIPEEEIVVFSQHFNQPALGFDNPIGMNDDNARSLSETISGWEDTPDEQVANEEISSRISQKLQEFYETLNNPRDQDIWNRRLIADTPISLQELGDEYGISKERVRQLEGRIKKNLKAFLEAEIGEDIAFEFAN